MTPELLEAMRAVRNAWMDAGVAPDHHDMMQRKLLREWPVLARAVRRLALEFAIARATNNVD